MLCLRVSGTERHVREGERMEEVKTFTAKNGETIILRPAVPGDAAEIINTVGSTSLERSYILMEHFGDDEESKRRYITTMDLNNNLLLVAVAGTAVLGSLAALQSERGERPHTAHILNTGLHILQRYRGLGIGSEMLRYAIEWARVHGFKKISARIFTINKRSLNLFRHAGFVEEGLRKKQIRIGTDFIDEVSMGLLL